jgi:hypothetical protein
MEIGKKERQGSKGRVGNAYYYEMVMISARQPWPCLALRSRGTIAKLGLSSFAKSKRENIEEWRIEVALDALAIVMNPSLCLRLFDRVGLVPTNTKMLLRAAVVIRRPGVMA